MISRPGLVTDALQMALQERESDGVIHHSDQGTQYTSIEFGLRCKRAGIRPSMGSVGDCYDNALCESASLECELIDRHSFRSKAAGQACCLRLHRGLLQPSPGHLGEHWRGTNQSINQPVQHASML